MSHSLKHKVLVLFSLVALLSGVASAAAPVTSAAMPVPLQIMSKMSCPPHQTVVKAGNGAGTGDIYSCCPSKALSGVADGDKPKTCLFAKYVNPLINLLSAAVGIVVVISVITGAIQFSSSAGDPQKAANGKNRIRNALLGLLAYLLLYAFLQFIIPGGKFNA